MQLKTNEEIVESSSNELNVQESQRLAFIIDQFKVWFPHLDLEYAKKAAAAMFRQANFQQSIAVLHPHHPDSKNQLLRLQGEAIINLVTFVEKLNECSEMKKKIGEDSEKFNEIEKLFI